MRLNLDTALVHTPDTSGPAPSGKSTQGMRTGAVDSGGDIVRLSGASGALHQLSGDRAARLISLASSVANGSYQISGSLIAGAVIRQAGG